MPKGDWVFTLAAGQDLNADPEKGWAPYTVESPLPTSSHLTRPNSSCLLMSAFTSLDTAEVILNGRKVQTRMRMEIDFVVFSCTLAWITKEQTELTPDVLCATASKLSNDYVKQATSAKRSADT